MRLQQRLEEHCEKIISNGVALVHQGDQNIYFEAHGYADILKKTPLQKDAQFLIGSITKLFTAAGLVKVLYDQVVSDSKINATQTEQIKSLINKQLRHPISHYLPPDDPIWSGKMPAWADEITLYQLLTHTSGIANITDDEKSLNQLRALDASECPPSKVVATFKDKPQSRSTSWSYSNSNYIILGIVIERITKLPLKTMLKDYFFDKLQMNDTAFIDEGSVKDLWQRPEYKKLCVGHEDWPLELKQASSELMNIPLGSGSICSTATDLLKWSEDLFIYHSHIPLVVTDMMTQRQVFKYKNDRFRWYQCYGLERCEEHTGKLIYFRKAGGIPGYNSVLHFFPQDEKDDICSIQLYNFQCHDELVEQNRQSYRQFKLEPVIARHILPPAKSWFKINHLPFKMMTALLVLVMAIQLRNSPTYLGTKLLGLSLSMFIAVGLKLNFLQLNSAEKKKIEQKKKRQELPCHLLQPSGQYQVGYQDFHWISQSLDPCHFKESKFFSQENKEKHREITVRIYYPSEIGNILGSQYYQPTIKKWQQDIPALVEMLKTTSSTYHEIVTQEDIKSLASITIAAEKDLPTIEGKKFPMVLFSPGMKSSAEEYSSLLLEFVSHGYFMVAVHHPFIDDTVEFPDGRIIKTVIDTPDEKFDIAACIQSDLLFCMKTLKNRHQEKLELLTQMDITHVGLLGHSLGGVATIKLAHEYPNLFAAGIALDAPADRQRPRTYDVRKKIPIPFLQMHAANWRDHYSGQLPKEDKSLQTYHGSGEFHNTFLLLAPDERKSKGMTYSGHGIFSDKALLQYHPAAKAVIPFLYLLNPALAIGTIDGNQALKIVGMHLQIFFDMFLKKKQNQFFQKSQAYPGTLLFGLMHIDNTLKTAQQKEKSSKKSSESSKFNQAAPILLKHR